MDLRFELKGDLAVQRRFQTAGDRVRQGVSEAMSTLLRMAQDTARSRAPKGPTGRLRSGIITWTGGNGWYKPPNNGNAITNKQIDRYKAFAKDAGSIYGVVASTWFTGRFFERGVSKKVWVGPDARKAGFNAYSRSMRKSLYNSAKKRGYGPVTLEKQAEYEMRATKASQRASSKELKRFKNAGFYRNQRLKQVEFMSRGRDAISGIYESVIQAAVTKAVAGGS